MEGKDLNSAVFSPKGAIHERKERDRDARKTPVPPSQVERAKQRKRHPKAKINEHFTTATVGKVLKRTIHEANQSLPSDQQIPKWTMYQLRHTFLTEKTEQFGEDIAALIAGHSNPTMIRDTYDHSQERRIIKLKQMEDEREQKQDESEGREAS